MSTQNFATSFTVDQSPDEVFMAVTNVRGWWTGDVEGDAEGLGDEFVYRYEDMHYSKQKVTEIVPGRKVVWRVVDAHLKFTEDPAEWTGTDITFEIVPDGDRTELRFTHQGLVPEFECYDNCSSAWGFYINGSLRQLITTGEGPMAPPWA